MKIKQLIREPIAPRPTRAKENPGTKEEWNQYRKEWKQWEKQEIKAGRMFNA